MRTHPRAADATARSNLKGRLFGILVGTGGKRVLGKALAATVKAIEARNYGTKQGSA